MEILILNDEFMQLETFDAANCFRVYCECFIYGIKNNSPFLKICG